MEPESDSRRTARKTDHIRFALSHPSASPSETWFNCVRLVHQALPDHDIADLSTTTTFLGHSIDVPFLIDALTGGTSQFTKLNTLLAQVAQTYNLPIAVGSQRILLDHPDQQESFRVIRDWAPDQPVLANLGISELVALDNDFTRLDPLLSVLSADALVIHLNPLQELIQPEGNRHFQGSLQKLERLVDYLSPQKIPLIIKEVGAGLSKEVITQLQACNIHIFNVAGTGGTNFAHIESMRAKEHDQILQAQLGQTFADWGIPTAAALLEAAHVRDASDTIIASGGIRTGLDIGKALCLGADLCGVARPFLEEAMIDPQHVHSLIKRLQLELKTCMLLTGASSLSDLRALPRVILPPLATWRHART